MCGYCTENWMFGYRNARLQDDTSACAEYLSDMQKSGMLDLLLMEADSVQSFLDTEGMDIDQAITNIYPTVWMACLQRDRLFAPGAYAAIDRGVLRKIVKQLVCFYIMEDAWYEEMDLGSFLQEMQPELDLSTCQQTLENHLDELARGTQPEFQDSDSSLPDLICSVYYLFQQSSSDVDALFKKLLQLNPDVPPFCSQALWLQRITALLWFKRYGLEGLAVLMDSKVREELLEYGAMKNKLITVDM